MSEQIGWYSFFGSVGNVFLSPFSERINKPDDTVLWYLMHRMFVVFKYRVSGLPTLRSSCVKATDTSG